MRFLAPASTMSCSVLCFCAIAMVCECFLYLFPGTVFSPTSPFVKLALLLVHVPNAILLLVICELVVVKFLPPPRDSNALLRGGCNSSHA